MAISIFPETDPANSVLIDAKGDLLAGSANDIVTRLAIGANNQVLTADSAETTGMKWASPTVGCAVFANGVSFAYTNGVNVILPFASETFDTNAFHDTVTNNSRITIPTGKGGNYLIQATQRITSIGVTYSYFSLYKNGAITSNEGLHEGKFSANPQAPSNGSIIMPLVAGDYIEVSYGSDGATGTYTLYAQFSAILLP